MAVGSAATILVAVSLLASAASLHMPPSMPNIPEPPATLMSLPHGPIPNTELPPSEQDDPLTRLRKTGCSKTLPPCHRVKFAYKPNLPQLSCCPQVPPPSPPPCLSCKGLDAAAPPVVVNEERQSCDCCGCPQTKIDSLKVLRAADPPKNYRVNIHPHPMPLPPQRPCSCYGPEVIPNADDDESDPDVWFNPSCQPNLAEVVPGPTTLTRQTETDCGCSGNTEQ